MDSVERKAKVAADIMQRVILLGLSEEKAELLEWKIMREMERNRIHVDKVVVNMNVYTATARVWENGKSALIYVDFAPEENELVRHLREKKRNEAVEAIAETILSYLKGSRGSRAETDESAISKLMTEAALTVAVRLKAEEAGASPAKMSAILDQVKQAWGRIG